MANMAARGESQGILRLNKVCLSGPRPLLSLLHDTLNFFPFLLHQLHVVVLIITGVRIDADIRKDRVFI